MCCTETNIFLCKLRKTPIGLLPPHRNLSPEHVSTPWLNNPDTNCVKKPLSWLQEASTTLSPKTKITNTKNYPQEAGKMAGWLKPLDALAGLGFSS